MSNLEKSRIPQREWSSLGFQRFSPPTAIWLFVCSTGIDWLHRALIKTSLTQTFFFNQSILGHGHDGWYPPPGLEENAQRPRNVSSTHPTLKNAVVTCGPPPAEPAKCGKKDGPCLFNIEEDPCEYTNLAQKETDVLNHMLKLLETYKSTMVPIRNKPYDKNANPKNHNGLWTAWCDEKPNENCGE